jgi:hypothetical protein
MFRLTVAVASLGLVLIGCGGGDSETAKALEVAKACIEAKGYRVSSDPDDRVAIQPSTQPESFTIFFPSGHVADVGFHVIEGVTDEFLTVPETVSAFSASDVKLTSVESAAIDDCSRRAVAAARK